MIDLLKTSRVFHGCTDQEMENIAATSQKLKAKEGERVFEAGSAAAFLYVVVDGAVDLRFRVTHYQVEEEVTLDRKFKGDAFGWSALTKPNIYTLSAIAVKDSELLKISKEDLKKLCNDNNHLGYVLMRNIAEIVGERFSSVQKTLIDVIQQNLSAKEL